MDTDDELARRFSAGDLDAFETLFRRHQAPVYAWIVRLVRNPAAAEDLTVETFWRIYRRRARYDPARPFLPWARRVATRLAIDHLRAIDPVLPDPPEIAAPQSDAVETREIRAAIRKAFSTLAPRLRAAATLALIEDLPYAAVAEALGISVSAAKMRTARAVRALRKTLERIGIRP